MRVYIANFGEGNYEWPTCKERGTIATMNDLQAQTLWEAGDKEGFIAHAMGRKHRRGGYPIKAVASRWFNLMTIIANSSGDVWIHKAKDELWWTVSKSSPPTFEVKTEPFSDRQRVTVCHKPCDPWSDRTEKGSPLRWNALHPKAAEFLATEATLQQLNSDYAAYTLALLRGDNLQPWEARPLWKKKTVSQIGKGGSAKIYGGWELAAARMADQAFRTAASSNGQQVTRTVKDKKVVGFADKHELERYLLELKDMQDELCMVTELKMETDGDSELAPSLDRIDSDGHYERGNMQVVCTFVNRWKNDGNNDEFKRLIGIVRGLGPVAPTETL
jgi:hypothetical protein